MRIVFVGFLSLIILSGCASISPYQVTNFFVDRDTVPQLRAQRIAVLPFQNSSGDYSAGSKVADEFNLQLGKLAAFDLIERIRVDELYKEQDFDPDRIDQETAVKIGKMLGVHGIILGNVIEYSKGKVGISIRLVNVETGKQIWQARDTIYATDKRVKVLVDGFGQRMRLKRDKEFLTQILCQLLTQTFKGR
ncbi:hypothetical protein AUJ95_01650 [Candidatus Desantisbacteria bacterium CG2_30_40_21]|uniref:Penicillin-binding protein activator LpoB n=5 Tax=unclassified Candidatus Desantisiibacteriota TaxID=3106372 RepID=A0A2M7JET9_9BACT|nr:MAG: hypothetical protein AUJ95_01650 [Candidatus Desantisbacteria bacterium CG2_30_40_21]PIP40596.1 MAG: hypothetical protein COX18_06160 [Candidatus Desantisbacteria bacterium CG23_combo_of_CG06-09_8_20_14_all_40_23]PIX17912.1 MAG: hypothetical protein COZ71_00785 [Candidatus Desantisbacteria bacterium CG_4_8_14_3_um_filter_40_12]PIY20437.1 MAG: hypothetical protein COZ13_00700 [Candidatus Desantisbacteria bacterium CG_4_10_14_3_um_filter_40_18]PJB28480.1 MAG: hypothetical protein CO110_09